MISAPSSERQPLLPAPLKQCRSHLSYPGESASFGPLDLPAPRRKMILIGIWLAQFLSALNLTLVPTMLPSISSEFNQSNQASWLGTSYLLATCTFTPLYGRLSDAMGRRGATQSAICFAGLGILCCGFSNCMGMLIASRFFSGLGGGGIFTTAAIITSDMYTMRSRSFIQSIGGIFYGLGMGLGGPIGGLITDSLGWRWAFLIQVPFFLLAMALVSINLTYTLPGLKGSTWDILKKIDYGGISSLFGMIACTLFFLSSRYNENQPVCAVSLSSWLNDALALIESKWSSSYVYLPAISAIILGCSFLCIEVYYAAEPILPPTLLTQKVPVLIGCSNALVAVCNLSVTYFFPVWFQTVMLSSASNAGLHLLPNSLCISTGSIFAGWVMHRTGRYKIMNMTFGCMPFIAAWLLTQLREDSGPAMKWLVIMPLGFGNAVVLQTLYIALVSNLPPSQLAIGTGFAQLLRGLGQVGGLASASAIFQSRLDVELRNRIHSPDAEQVIEKIRHSAKLISTLPLDLQRVAKDSYAASFRAVFILAACASLLAYILRIPIPDKELEDHLVASTGRSTSNEQHKRDGEA